MHPAEEPEPQRPREIAVSPAASSSRPGAGPASPGDLVGGAGVASSLGTDPEARLFTSTPGGAPAPVAVPSAAPQGRLGEQLPPLAHWGRTAPSGRPAFPPQALTFPGLPGPGCRWRGEGGGRGEGTRDCVPQRHEPWAPPAPAPGFWPEAVGCTARGCPKPSQTPSGSDGHPLVPNRRQ